MRLKGFFTLALGLVPALSGPALFAQGEAAAKLQAQAGNGIIYLVVYDKDQKEIGKGTAAVLADKIAVTSYHLVSGAAQVAGFNAKKKKVNVLGIMAVDKNLDLALLQIDGKATPLPAGSPEAIATGKTIYGLGANESGDVMVSEGTVRNLFEAVPGTKVADTSLAVPETFNGAAVIDAEGKMAGLLVVMDSRLRFVVPITAVNALNKTAKPTPWKSWTAEDYKNSFEGAWLAGRLYGWLDDTLGAQRSLEKVTKLQPNNLEAWTQLASIYDRQRDYNNAVTAYRKVVELDPNRAAAHFGLGQILTKLQKGPEGAAALEKAIALDPSNREALLALGDAYEQAREFAKAAGAYQKYVATNPPNAWMAHRSLGRCLLETNQFEQAAAAFAEAAKTQPDDNNLIYQMAQAYERGNKLAEAEAAYKKLAELSPKDATNYYSMIMRMYDIGNQPAKAVEAARKVAELNPKNDQYTYYLAALLQKNKSDAEAVEVFKQVLAVNPTSEPAWFGLGVSYYNLKNFKDGAAAFKKNVEVKPDSNLGWLYLGICYMQVKDFNNAVVPLEKAVELQPDSSNALFNLGVTYLNLKKRVDALEIVKRLKAVDVNLANKLQSYIK
jgi:tetratricopeptide (TPR) repeat protein